MPTTLPKPPITCAEVPDAWVAAVREAASVREGVPLRANAINRTIEAWSVNRGRWMAVMMPGGGTELTTDADLAQVWARLEGK